jgi:hypothetical protein
VKRQGRRIEQAASTQRENLASHRPLTRQNI